MSNSVNVETRGRVRIVTINRPDRRNAVDLPTAEILYETFKAFDTDANVDVAVLTGTGGMFCAGADLKALAEGEAGNRTRTEGDFAPMGPGRLVLSKPVIAAIEGFAVAGGMELALWCDLRVMAEDATFGIFCRRFGVPLVDLGTVNLPRLIGHSRAMDLILTGRPVGAEEAERIGLANRVAPSGKAVEEAVKLAEDVAAHPQTCLRNDRLSAIEQWDLGREEAVKNEIRRGIDTLKSGETQAGAGRFASGAGRGGSFES